MSQETCVFCKIVAGELRSYKIYEDKDVMSFMDINPLEDGHVLVIPKQHYEFITEIPDELLSRVITIVKKIAMAHYKILGASGVNVTQANGVSAGQVIPHIHFHVIPRYADHERNWTPKKEKDTKLSEIASRLSKYFA